MPLWKYSLPEEAQAKYEKMREAGLGVYQSQEDYEKAQREFTESLSQSSERLPAGKQA